MLTAFSTYNDYYITKKGDKTSGRADDSLLCRIMRASYARFCVGSVMERLQLRVSYSLVTFS